MRTLTFPFSNLRCDRYSPYANQNHTKNTIFAIFDLLHPNRHNIPTIENLVANTQLILEQLGISIF